MFKLSLVVSFLVACAIPAQTPLPAPKPKQPEGTWILQVEGDARSMKVVGVTHKVAPYRAPRRMQSQFRLQLLDANGKLLKSTPIDLSDFCLDPAHVGKKDHVNGDRIVQHKVCMTFKVPAIATVASIRIAKVTGATPTIYGELDRKTLDALQAKSREVR